MVVVITDRKDYYHQLYVTPARFSTNAVGPSVHKMLLQDTDAYSAYMLASSMSKRARRGRRGANLHDFSLRPGEASDSQPLPKDSLWACFESVLQGDHAGVEIATSAHERWLQQCGLVDEQSKSGLDVPFSKVLLFVIFEPPIVSETVFRASKYFCNENT